ncbi:anaerobic sulfite reductase subunit AsrB [Anaerotalea alkaliphila]|uniref:Anaerobic sulfite reductase subunit AsrB n=1 Tax=Anaerotalea alkaliphila TaxID=2662126 RepID=A0A7X5HTY5_9FIRM|nr:anaerobic sulfite reductase subunit AsrB [Anaerotalea alkaliphila]NDL66612.1 anaerobic sulfite reductase subunit AsrB [Anaerotalea alkaliphila]
MTNPYLPKPYELVGIRKETAIDYTYTIDYQGPVTGGQFMEVSIPGVGEAPISISDFDGSTIDMTIRKVGRLTDKIFEMEPGDSLFLRGPYGNGFQLDNFKGRDLVVIAGGTGLAPVKKTIQHYMENLDQVKSLEVLLGFKSPSDILFTDDILRWEEKAKVILSVDNPVEGWDGHTGLVTTHVTKLDLSNVKEKTAIVVGPPIMMKFMTLELLKNGFLEENIWVSFERKMSCGIGKCGHCKIDETYVCLEGPVFNYTKAKNLLD